MCGCLLSNRQGLVFKRSCLLVPFFGISWVFPCASSGPSTDGHTQSSCTCWVPSIDELTHAHSDLQVSLCFVKPAFWRRRPLPSHSCGLRNYGYWKTFMFFFVYDGFMVSFLGRLFGVPFGLPACGWRFGSGPGRSPSPPVLFLFCGVQLQKHKGHRPKNQQ